MMATPPPFRCLRNFNPSFFLLSLVGSCGGSGVEVADAALGYHGFDFAVQGCGEHVAELHFEACGVLDDGRREENLVGGAEGEGLLVGLH